MSCRGASPPLQMYAGACLGHQRQFLVGSSSRRFWREGRTVCWKKQPRLTWGASRIADFAPQARTHCLACRCSAEFAGFNAVFGDIRTPGSLKYVTNRVDGGDIAACLLPRAATLSMSSTPFSKASAVTLDRAGAHALSNSHLNDTSWPRVHFMEAEMQALQQVHVWGAPAATPTTLPPQLQPLQELPGVLAALRRVTRTLSAGNVTVPPFTSPAPRGLLDWSPLPEPLEVFLQSHCRLPIITQAFLSQTWLACTLSMLKRLLPGGLQTAAALSAVLLSVAWAGLFAVTPEAWGVTWRLASTLPLSLLGLAGAGAALASSAQRYVKALLPYGSRAASLLLRTQQGAWYAYAALDQGGGTVGAQREATVEELNAAVCEAVHVPSKDLPQTDLLPPGGLVVHRDRHGTLQLLPATQGTPAESLDAAATLPHTQRSLQVGDLSWQVFFSGGHVAASSERL